MNRLLMVQKQSRLIVMYNTSRWRLWKLETVYPDLESSLLPLVSTVVYQAKKDDSLNIHASKIVDMGIEPMTFCALACEADVIATTPIDSFISEVKNSTVLI